MHHFLCLPRLRKEKRYTRNIFYSSNKTLLYLLTSTISLVSSTFYSNKKEANFHANNYANFIHNLYSKKREEKRKRTKTLLLFLLSNVKHEENGEHLPPRNN